MNRADVSIIIPAHNEEGILEKTVNSVIGNVNLNNYELLICNDHSTDNTLKIAEKLAKKHNKIRVLSNTDKPGFGKVMHFGFRHAKGEFVVPIMADLCDDIKTINFMFEKTKQSYDVVVGSRYIKGGSKRNVQNHFKSFCSWLIGQIGWYMQGIKTHDTTNAFKMMRKSAVLDVNPTSNNFDLSLELTVKLHKKGYKITEVPTIWTDRSEGASKFKIFNVAKKYVKWLIR